MINIFKIFRRTQILTTRCVKFSSQQQTDTIAVESAGNETNITKTKYDRIKLPSREPLAKNFFLAKVDKELLSFPEVISREDMASLQEETANFQHIFESEDLNEINRETRQKLIDNGIFGLNIHNLYNGKEFGWSETLLATNLEINNSLVSKQLLHHRIVSDLIVAFGTKNQKDKYLSKLSNGTFVGGVAVSEERNPNNPYFSTTAEIDLGTNTWVMNGEKSFLPLDSSVNLLVVLAQTTNLSPSGDLVNGVTAFILETSLPGVKINDQKNNLGFISINFDNVKLGKENIIGEPNEGSKPGLLLLQSDRIRSSHLGVGILKGMINRASKYVAEGKNCGIKLRDMESITSTLSKIASSAYAIESMLYFICGLIDEFDNQDIEMETALLKLFTSKCLWDASGDLLSILGGNYLLQLDGQKDISNILMLNTQSELQDTLKMLIALTGLKHASITMHEVVNKARNPLYNPSHIFKKFFQNTGVDNPQTKMLLNEHLHPSLEPAAQNLEHSIFRLNLCTEILLTRYGNDIVSKHSEMKRLSEMVTYIFATFAALARSSRSYCIGLRHSDYEILMALTISQQCNDLVKKLAIEIEHGSYSTNDNNYQRLTKQIINSKGYFSENPLSYNF